MDGWTDRLDRWAAAHPWSWGSLGALVMGAVVLSLQVFVDRHSLDEAVPTCAVIMLGWFVLLGTSAWRRGRRRPG
jgi:hypothetical protein